jgi:hypothetical protein
MEGALAGNSDVHRWNAIVKSKAKNMLLPSTERTVMLTCLVHMNVFANPY